MASRDSALPGARSAPATMRNRDPILEQLKGVLTADDVVLEIASGTGEHACYLAPRLDLQWQPTDPSVDARGSIAAWRQALGAERWVAPPLPLDVMDTPWPVTHATAIICINMIHIAPEDAAVSLFEGAAKLLPKNSPLIVYGPFKKHGRHTAASNAEFDAHLKARDPRFGVRDLAWIEELAHAQGFRFDAVTDMPANNFMLVCRAGRELPA